MDLPLPDQLGHGPHRVLDGHIGIDAVLVVKVDLLDAQPLEGSIAALANVFGPSVDAHKAAVRTPYVAELRGQEDLAAAIPDRLPHEDLVLALAVNVGRVQEIDPQFQRAVDRGDGLGLVAGTAELAHAHATQAHGRDHRALLAQLPFFHLIAS